MNEKTEKPSQRKLKKARERGNLPKSSELASAIIFCGALTLFWIFSSQFGSRFKQVFSGIYASLAVSDLDNVLGYIKPLLYLTLFTLIAILAIAVLAQFVQTGWVWSWPKGKSKQESRGFFFSVKVGVIALIGYLELRHFQPSDKVLVVSSAKKMGFIIEHVFALLFKLSLALLLLGILDYLYQRWKYQKEMQMTKQEVKEEKRSTEGDKETKGRMRRR